MKTSKPISGLAVWQCPKCHHHNVMYADICLTAGCNYVRGAVDSTLNHGAGDANNPKPVSRQGATVKTPGNGNFCKSFWHPCIPPTATAQQRRHASNGHSYMPANVRKAQQQLAAIFSQYAPGNPAVGPITVFLSITYPHVSGTRKAERLKEIPKVTRPDCDNLAKLMLDAATDAGWWTDDSQVTELNIRKLNGPEPGIKFSVKGV